VSAGSTSAEAWVVLVSRSRVLMAPPDEGLADSPLSR
jgi:hypothetical protein